ncbi:MAG: hypothetical protein Tsb0014_19400 [Pleurocapsa sp.]
MAIPEYGIFCAVNQFFFIKDFEEEIGTAINKLFLNLIGNSECSFKIYIMKISSIAQIINFAESEYDF